MLGVASIVPWGELTDNLFKDYNLFSDVCHGSLKATAEEIVDPELAAAIAETENTEAAAAQTGATPDKPVDPSALSMYEVASPKAPVNNVVDGVVIIEDYTEDNRGMYNLRRALAQSGSRNVRIAVIGDSYIEGDILTMNLREMLQGRYGGAGVGYMPASSELTGFRTTVRQTCSGWEHHEIRKDMSADKKIIQGEYFTARDGATVSYRGVSNPSHLSTWSRTMVLAIAPQGGTLEVTSNGTTSSMTLEPGDQVQALCVPGSTSSVSVSASAGVEVLGVYLDETSGVSVDNMSLRGNSGQTHRKLSVERAEQMRQYVDYDLIIVEYGINALSSQQSNYNGYEKIMKQTVSRLRECYPNADILMMGIGDRGQKIGSEVKSIPTSDNMVEAQRNAARETGVLFWDTRCAMGGEGAVVEWRNNHLINPDYIHLNQKGGEALAQLLMEALSKAL